MAYDDKIRDEDFIAEVLDDIAYIRYVKAMWEDKKTRQRSWKKWQNYRENYREIK